ncbi:AI-2E family transporter [Ancylobacter amanitiformis]|uniref:PurR-regulated permease PerM n=1 Tax=Ancylobacter amanitiformis TaxID=217069 RepID=A0ABU0LUC0_9HYPH|nr:AI-2E family transporter [Ancylobacter amanitiformis]MDQ0512322.1 putative PurR-regulated permease PerM [Ancylobacter amanitiformis]
MKRHIVAAAEARQGVVRQAGTRRGPGDPPPEEKRGERLWRRTTQVAIIVTAVIVLAAAMVVARAVLVPIVAAVIIGSVIGPAIEAMARRGVPTPLGSALIVAVLAGLLYGAAVILAAPLADWTARAPEIGAIVQDRFAALKPALHTVSSFVETIESLGRAAEPPMTVRLADSRMLESALGLVTPAIGELILFTGSLVFFLAGRIQIKRRLVQAIGPRSTRLAALRVFREIEDRLGAYLVTATFINIGLGVATALITWALGLPSPLLWGALACLLNYVPYLGPAVMVVILAVAGIVSFPGIVQALLPAAAFVALTSVEGHVLTPLIISRRVSLNPFAVFLSMALWTWLWGPAGTFLAVPLLIAAMALADGVIARRRPDLPG